MIYFESYYGVSALGEPYLCHHGVKGMHWGVRRYQNKDGTLTVAGKRRYDVKDILRNARTYNIDTWGKDEDHNILYITGYSGSGKSTAAENLANDSTDVIHLDIYLEPWMESKETGVYQCKELNEFLDKKRVPYKKLRNGSFNDETGKPYNNKEYWKAVDLLQNGIEEFGKQQFGRSRRVVVEGVALSDDTMYEYKTGLRGKPLAIMKSGSIKSTWRAAKRDLGKDMKPSDAKTLVNIAYRKTTLDRKNLRKLDQTMRTG